MNTNTLRLYAEFSAAGHPFKDRDLFETRNALVTVDLFHFDLYALVSCSAVALIYQLRISVLNQNDHFVCMDGIYHVRQSLS